MKTAIHIFKFLIKILLFVIFSPIIIVWFVIQYTKYKSALIQFLIQSGMPKDYATQLAKETRPSKMFW